MPARLLLQGALAGLIVCVLAPPGMAQSTVTQGTNLSVDVSKADGRIAFDLLGSIWVMPANGGDAQELANVVFPARSPRWSPSGRHLLYNVSSPDENQIWLHDLSSNQPQRLSTSGISDRFASWHPGGERICFSSSGTAGGLDLWELDISTGLRWRLTHNSGDETEAAWSANGRDLVYVLRDDSGWSLVLRRNGEPDRKLHQSPTALRAPSWRPDGSLVTFLSETGSGYVLDMAILSDPPLVRHYSDNELDFFLSPVSWLDRHRMIYTADGMILTRRFNDRRASPLRFRARIDNGSTKPGRHSILRPLTILTPPKHKLVIRAARLFDGIQNGYRHLIDVVTDGATISTVARRQEWPDATVLDLGDVTVLPGFIDVYSSLPQGEQAAVGAGLLAYGVTTIVSDDRRAGFDPALWHSEQTPGPRLITANDIASRGKAAAEELYLVTLPANTALDDGPRKLVRHWQRRGIPVLADNWTVGLGLGVDMLLGAGTLPTSPVGRQYQDLQIVVGASQVTLVSGLADSATPGISQLFRSRQALQLRHRSTAVRRLANARRLDQDRSSVILGSKPSGLPAGLATHAELRALTAAGLNGDQVLRAAGSNAALALGFEKQLGHIAPGSLADLVIVAGDPLNIVSDALNIVAVVRNGRFYSLVSLLERAGTATNVE